ncbi:AAA family ATPase [Picosynechococcus sp. PCC 7117]|uniref:AAA family ATPase n=1 Tax=Picosynechococcus sp. PCC 7117 TaxID=195498 RepID=UPI00081085C7|nr:AAA family ATPase [Picosynechococcus sp. PCC 7117]ANV88638.1 chromosome partitioning protein ParA [Picosynechococcus sp. PCC 7117]
MIPDPSSFRNETEVESKLIVHYLLPKLGYPPNTWYQEVAFGNIRLDFMAFTATVMPFTWDSSSPLNLIIEAKSPRENLDRHVPRLRTYLTSLKSPYGILTNGKDFRIYERDGSKIDLCFQCSGSEIDANLEKIKFLVGRESLKPVPSSRKKSEIQPEKNLTARKNRMKIIAVYHNKGGVGKTTTVVNLAAALQKQGKRILIVDLDSQANTTYATGLAKFLDEKDDDLKNNNILQLIQSREKYPVKAVARPSTYVSQGIDVIPSHIEMMKYESELTRIEPAKTRLLSKLKDVKNDYDIVLIDTPPSLNLYARIALLSAGYLIIPSDLKPFANEGLNNVKDFIADINEAKDMFGMSPLKILGVLPSKISTNARFVQYTYPKRRRMVEQRYGFPLMSAAIYEREDLAKALENTLEYGEEDIPDPLSIFDYKSDSVSAHEFAMLASEVLEKIN